MDYTQGEWSITHNNSGSHKDVKSGFSVCRLVSFMSKDYLGFSDAKKKICFNVAFES
jgi:hypothetical protein